VQVNLTELNQQLAEKLISVHTHEALAFYRQGSKMLTCKHLLDSHRAGRKARYCRSACCLLCRRENATRERKTLQRLLADELQTDPKPIVLFATFTLRHCTPAEVKTHAGLLVRSCAKLLRKPIIKRQVGWKRTIEVKTADPNKDLENCHAHLILIIPPGWVDEVNALGWEALWSECAGPLARTAVVEIARTPQAVANYLTKSQAWNFEQDGEVGKVNPLRYWLRTHHGHAKFSGGGRLRLEVFNALDKLTGVSQVLSRSSNRNKLQHMEKLVAEHQKNPIQVEGD
jgi:hypothetical protein